MQKGNIGVTTENIFPLIKKFLYSDHDIFIREIVSNAVDATQKLRTLAAKGELTEEPGDLTVHVAIDKEAGTLTVSDRGIGMTAEEIDQYINQIAFSGANDFLDKYKEDANAIIGHFGLGFYSAFMVSNKVEIVTRSYLPEAQAVRWSCDGSPAYEIEETDKSDRGTDIIMHIDDDCKEFLEESKIEELLRKYCHFLPIAVAFGKKKEWKDGKQQETDEDNIINDTEPLWTKKPADLKDEDYKQFYRQLYPMADEPLFWIHLNVDYPFHLTGVLYFPKVKTNIDLQRNKIQLYCNQVFVTDNVESVVPDFLTLLHGVIDSPDIPLNVSRSYLQSDRNVKKIASYISKKVSDRLKSIWAADRPAFEQKWDDLKIFLHFGMLSEPDFYDKANGYCLLKDTDGKFFTYEEYRTLVKDQQTDKDGQLILLYANDKEAEWPYIEAAQKKGYNVLLLDGQLDTAMLSLWEHKWGEAEDLKSNEAIKGAHFCRVDSDVIDRLIVKDDTTTELEAEQKEKVEKVFKDLMPALDKTEWHIDPQSLGETTAPLTLTQNEWMRRMKDMARLQPGMAFYGDMPDTLNVVVNTDHPLIQRILADAEGTADTAHQLVALALLQNGLLRGEALTQFIAKSIELLQ